LKEKNKNLSRADSSFPPLARPNRAACPRARARARLAQQHAWPRRPAQPLPRARLSLLPLTNKRPCLSSPSSRLSMAINDRRPSTRGRRAPGETELHQHHHANPTNLALCLLPQQPPRREPHPDYGGTVTTSCGAPAT
jgi:hypothetical protein